MELVAHQAMNGVGDRDGTRDVRIGGNEATLYIVRLGGQLLHLESINFCFLGGE